MGAKNKLVCLCERKKCKGPKCKHFQGHHPKAYARTTAARADKHVLYQRSVQNVGPDLDFAERVFKGRFGRTPTDLREDFCGTALCACKWAKRRETNRAWGIDLDTPTLEWATAHNLSKLSPEAQSRVSLVKGDVLDARTPPVDVGLAQNFSFCIFKTRPALEEYFTAARRALKNEGLFVLDLFGGPEAQMPLREKTKHKRFTYVWHQKSYDAITNETLCHIHFHFPDGSKLKKAFTYDWRLWTIAELKELLVESGFASAEAYWEGPGKDGTGDGKFARTKNADNEDAWITYVVAAVGEPKR
jgi:SAM-dependent methyltransferase